MRKLIVSLGMLVLGIAITGLSTGSASAAVESTNYFVTQTANGNIHDYPCNTIKSYDHPAVPIVAVENNCDVEGWFYSSGESICFSPHTYGFGRFSPERLTITGRTAPCDGNSDSAVREPAVDTNYVTIWFSCAPGGSCPLRYPCDGNTAHSFGPVGIFEVVNDCSVRVWGHSEPNGGGQGQCFNPHSTTEKFDFLLRQVQITTNTASC